MVGGEKVEKVIRSPTELPAGWQRATLAEVAEIIMGQSPSSQYYNSDAKGLPFFEGKAEFGQLYPKPVKWCSQPNKVAQKDDVLMSVRAPVGPTNLAISECCIVVDWLQFGHAMASRVDTSCIICAVSSRAWTR